MFGSVEKSERDLVVVAVRSLTHRLQVLFTTQQQMLASKAEDDEDSTPGHLGQQSPPPTPSQPRYDMES